MAKWEVALDKLLELYTAWNSDLGKLYAKEWTEGFVDSIASGKDAKYRKAAENIWDDLHYRIGVQLWRAEPIYIDPDMMNIVDSVAPTFEPEAILESDLITQFGWIHLPRPFYFNINIGEIVETDSGPQTVDKIQKVAVRYIMWGIEEHIFDSGNKMNVLLTSIWKDPADLDDYTHFNKGERLTKLLTLIPTPLDGKTTYSMAASTGQWIQTMRILQVIWRLMQQTITVKQQIQPNRDTRKRVEKSKYPEKNITVITLRRPKSAPSGEHRDVEWTHRWVVGMHWRWQWYAITGREEICGHKNKITGEICQMTGGVHRQKLIDSYIKGPEDKPLELRKERVFQWTR